ncbi:MULTISPECIES: hypothetical protein [Acinetobacter]|uniref:hypothetical protein n=1 Tax=Acinetobacter TaxID=469 RepID=UPI00141BAA52|nr:MULTISPECIES: hypothetical protein [Acinetobacter]MCS4299154.1 hypothetical protein [Acinetobacter guillouiae]MCW2250199.1 hypothetical protein [Acinetobacter sp. BIGb0204]NII39302.1 hypothetical protein [Acinetobacter sp. BIGb0196]
MKVQFSFNWTQEDEGGEIIHFPVAVIYTEDSSGEKQYWSDATHFVSSFNTTESVYRLLKIINLFQLENMMRKVEISHWNDFEKAIIEESHIKFKERFGDSYHNELDLESFEKILNKWIEYLLTVDKQKVSFDI